MSVKKIKSLYTIKSQVWLLDKCTHALTKMRRLNSIIMSLMNVKQLILSLEQQKYMISDDTGDTHTHIDWCYHYIYSSFILAIPLTAQSQLEDCRLDLQLRQCPGELCERQRCPAGLDCQGQTIVCAGG